MANKAQFDIIINAVGHLEKAIKELRTMGSETAKTTKNTKDLDAAQGKLNYSVNQGVTGVSSAARSFSKLNQAIGNGPNGLVGAYATLAANAFAVSAAFGALREAAQVEQMMKGLETQGARTGKSLTVLSKDLQELTNYSISAADAMQATALMSSAGFSSQGMKDLTTVANNAALALGRNVPDALDRISKGVTKLEPELLDELGIMTKLSEAQAMYALKTNKSALSLSSFEKRQAMLNAVVAEGQAKFGGLSDQVSANPYDQLGATFSNLTKDVLGFANGLLGPIAKIFGSNQGMLLGGVLLFVSSIKKQLMPALFEMSKNAQLAKNRHLEEAEAIKVKTAETLKNAKAVRDSAVIAARSKTGTIAGAALPKKFRTDDIKQGTLSVKELNTELGRLDSSIRARETGLDGKGAAAVSAAKIPQKTAELELIKRERENLKSLIDLETKGQTDLTPLREAARKGRFEYIAATKLASSEGLKSQALEAAAAGKLKESWEKAKEAAEEYRKSIAAQGKAERVKPDGSVAKQGILSTLGERAKGIAGSVGIFAQTATAGFMKFLPYIGIATTALSGAYAVYKNFFQTDAEKARIEALRKLKETLDNTAKSVKELNRINESSIPLGLKAAQTLIIQSNASMEIAQAFKEVEEATAKAKDGSKTDSFWKALVGSPEEAAQYLTGITDPKLLEAATKELENGAGPKIGAALGGAIGAGLGVYFSGGMLTPYLAMGGTIIGNKLGMLLQNSLPEEFNGIDEAALESLRAIDQLSKVLDSTLVESMVAASGGMDELAKNPAMRMAFIQEAAAAYAGVADAVKSLQEAFKSTGEAITKFFRNSIPSTAFDDLVTGFTAINKSFIELDRTLGGSKASQQIKLIASMPDEVSRMLDAPQQQLVTNLKQQGAQLTANAEIISGLVERQSTLNTAEEERLKSLQAQNASIEAQMETADSQLSIIKDALRTIESNVRANQRQSREYDSQLKLVNAIASMNSEIYSQTAEGEKARIDRNNEAIRLQQAQLELQINITETYISQAEAVIRTLEAQQLQLDVTKQMDLVSMQAAERSRKAERDARRNAALVMVDDKNLVSPEYLQGIDTLIASFRNNVDPNKINTGTIAYNGLSGAALQAAQSYGEAARAAERASIAVNNAISIKDNTDQIADFRQNIDSLRTSIAALQTSIIGPSEALARISQKRQEYQNAVEAHDREILFLNQEINESLTSALILERGRTNAIRDSLRLKVQEAQRNKQTLREESGVEIGRLQGERAIIVGKLADKLSSLNQADREAYTAYIALLDRQIVQEEQLNTLRQQRLAVTTRQQVLETIIAGGLEESISRLNESIELRKKELELVNSLADKQTQIAQNRSRIALARVGATPDERTQKAFEIEAAEAAYAQAVQQSQLRMASIDAEYALLEAKRDMDVETLKTQAYLLRVYDQIFTGGRNSAEVDSIVANVTNAAGRMNAINFDNMRELAKQNERADLEILGQRRDLAREEYTQLGNSYGGLQGLLQNWIAETQSINRGNSTRNKVATPEQTSFGLNLADQVIGNRSVVGELIDLNTSISNIEKAIVPNVDEMLATTAPTLGARVDSFIDPSSIVSGINWSEMNTEFVNNYGNMLGAFFADNPNSPFRQGVSGTSGLRTQADQDRILASGIRQPDGSYRTPGGEPIAARVGFGHGTGQATDQSRAFVQALREWGKGSQFGLEVGSANGQVDEVHIQALRSAVTTAVSEGASAAAAEVGASVATGTTAGLTSPEAVRAAAEVARIRSERIAAAETAATAPLVNANNNLAASNNAVIDSNNRLATSTQNAANDNNLSVFQDFLAKLPRALQIVEVQLAELGTAMTERLGQDFGPQGKVLSAINNLMRQTRTTTIELVDAFSKLKPQAPVAPPTPPQVTGAAIGQSASQNMIQNAPAIGAAISAAIIPPPPATPGVSTTVNTAGAVAPVAAVSNTSNIVAPEVSQNLSALGQQGNEVAGQIQAGLQQTDAAIGNSAAKVDTAKEGMKASFSSIAGAASSAFGAIASQIGAIAGLLKASSDAKIAQVDKEIAAEQKRDGKSAGSLAKIESMEKKKEAMAKKQFKLQKALMIAQAIMSTASGVAGALSLVGTIGPAAFALAGLIGAMGLAQVAIISGMQYESNSTPKAAAMPTSLSIGKRSDTVDLAKGPNANAGGEVGYLRGSEGTGSNASNYRTVGSAYGGELMRGYGNRGFVVGEKGPEVITPDTPISVTPANDVGGPQAINASFNIHAIDSQGVQDVLVAQKGNIIKMLREAANASGKSFMEDVNVNVYTRSNVGKL